MRFEALIALKMYVFWIVMPCRLHFGGTYYLDFQGLNPGITSPHGVTIQKAN